MVSRLLSITALFVFFLSTNSFAGCGSSDLSVLQNQSLDSWSSKNLTITITEKGSRCSPNYKVKVKDLETLLKIKYKALSPGTFVIDLTKADKDNQIILTPLIRLFSGKYLGELGINTNGDILFNWIDAINYSEKYLRKIK